MCYYQYYPMWGTFFEELGAEVAVSPPTTQTRPAVGQLFDCEYFQVEARSENLGKTIKKHIAYSKEPPGKIISFLKTYNVNVYWRSSHEIHGDLDSENIPYSFLSDPCRN
ncbi:acyl-CoA dehydratase activase-related protein [Chloroflexota bacterium]